MGAERHAFAHAVPCGAVVLETPAHLWPGPWRYGTAAVNGAAWAFLWYGSDLLGVPSLVILVVTTLLVAPVLAFVGRGWRDWAAVTATAFGVSLVMSYAIFPFEASQWGALAVSVLRPWIPLFLLDAGLYALRRRYAGF
jgi:hypothetical protein